jgi:molybdopterin-containing oxidoreductase family membrane subunit
VALIVGIVFYLLQVSIAFSGDMHGHQASLRNLFFDPSCDSGLAIFMYAAMALAVLGIVLLLVPQLRRREEMLVVAAGAIILACWLDKGLASSLGEFMPNSFGQITGYAVSLNEIAIICGVYGIGLLVVSVLYKVVFAVFKGSGNAVAEAGEQEGGEA